MNQMVSVVEKKENDFVLVDPKKPYIDYFTDELLEPYEWVVDEFIYVSAIMIAGSHGAGKTSTVVPLALAVCHAIRHEGIQVTIPRKVLYIAEDISQVKRMVYGSIKHQKADIDHIKENFKIRQARRVGVNFHREIAELIESLTTTFNGQKVYPLVVYDTAAANFQIGNENDNSEVSEVVSTLRHLFVKCPLWIVAHMAKSIKRGDLSDMSSRGASAWEADVQGVFYLFVDEDEKTRVLYGGAPVKRRDHGSIKEISLHGAVYCEDKVDRFGKKQAVPFMVIDAEVSSTEERKETAERKKEQIIQQAEDDAMEKAMVAVMEVIKQKKEYRNQEGKLSMMKRNFPTKNTIYSDNLKGECTRKEVDKAVEILLEENKIFNNEGDCTYVNNTTRKTVFLDV